MSERQVEWVEREINHLGEYHPVGLLFDGEVQLWVIGCAPEPTGYRGDPRRMVCLKSMAGKLDHGIINDWKIYDDDDAAKEAAQQYVDDNWDYVCSLRESGAQSI